MAKRKKKRRLAASKIRSIIGHAAIERPKTQKSLSTVERMLKAGKITTEQFWCAQRFTACHEAATAGPGVAARGFEERSPSYGGATPTYSQDALLVIEWRRIREAMADRKGALMAHNMIHILVMVLCHGVTLERVDRELMQTKGLASNQVCAGLQFLESHWSYEIASQKKAATRGIENRATL